MNKFLNNTRSTENEIPVSRKIRNTILILCLGIVLGTFSKFLDNTASNALPFIFEYLDVRNFCLNLLFSIFYTFIIVNSQICLIIIQ